jgi:acetylglutamate kinase
MRTTAVNYVEEKMAINIDEELRKAEVLIEALPYIQKFNRKIIVVKYGGSAMVDENLKRKVIEDVVLLKLVGFKPIIVHGGGKEISSWVKKSGMEPRFVNGLRVTDEPTMEIAEMVLNKVNKSLVSLIQELGVKACGISGKDGGMLHVQKKYSDGEDIGYVGDVDEVDPTIIHALLKDDFLPVICPIGFGSDNHAYNINADDAACAIAQAVNAEKLAFLTDTEGVFRDFDDKDSLISELTTTEARELLAGGTIGGGMLPKLNNCIEAVERGVSRVHIMDGRIPHCLLLEIFTNKGVGTAILSEGAEHFYDTNI